MSRTLNCVILALILIAGIAATAHGRMILGLGLLAAFAGLSAVEVLR